jgi:hypothetical protein
MKKILSLTALLLMTAMLAFPLAAHAVPTIQLWDGINAPIVITDNSPLDSNGLLGGVTFIGAYGPWLVNVPTGITKPIIGNPTNAAMDFNSVDLSVGPVGGFLQLKFTETTFILGGPNHTASMAIGGTTNGSIGYSAYYDNANVPFGTAGVIGNLGPFGPTAFSGSLTSPALTNNPFSLTQIVTIQHNAAGTTSFNAALNVAPVPIPSAGLLVGSVLLGLLGLRRKTT